MIHIQGCSVKRSGISAKNGKQWTIYGVQVEGQKFPVDCFTDMSTKIGQSVEGELVKKTYQKKDGGEGYSFELKLPKGGYGGGADVGALKDMLAKLTSDNAKLTARVEKLEQGTPNGALNTDPAPIPDEDIPF